MEIAWTKRRKIYGWPKDISGEHIRFLRCRLTQIICTHYCYNALKRRISKIIRFVSFSSNVNKTYLPIEFTLCVYVLLVGRDCLYSIMYEISEAYIKLHRSYCGF